MTANLKIFQTEETKGESRKKVNHSGAQLVFHLTETFNFAFFFQFLFLFLVASRGLFLSLTGNYHPAKQSRWVGENHYQTKFTLID